MPPQAVQSTIEKRRSEDFSEELLKKGWYHSFDLPGIGVIDGIVTLPDLKRRWSEMPLPADLTGKRVLDIGTWDGWCAFEAERRGAAVVAVDCVEQENFQWLHRKLGSKISYEIAEIYDLPKRELGKFDYTLFLGVLYHLRHPLRGLDIVCELTEDVAIVDSFIVDDDTGGTARSPIPWMEFYETNELANQIDNWHGPTLECLLALCRAAGFARVEPIGVHHRHALVACYRHWETPSANLTASAPELSAAVNGRLGDGGINFRAGEEEFLSCWFRSSQSDLAREKIRMEVSGYGAPALTLESRGESEWLANFRLPPGLAPGWHNVVLRTVDSPFSNPCRIAIDVPAKSELVKIRGACDAVTWRESEVDLRGPSGAGHVALWLEGLSEVADRNNVRVYCNGLRQAVEYVAPLDTSDLEGSGLDSSRVRQVNARLSRFVEEGEQLFHVEFGGARSEPVRATIRRS